MRYEHQGEGHGSNAVQRRNAKVRLSHRKSSRCSKSRGRRRFKSRTDPFALNGRVAIESFFRFSPVAIRARMGNYRR